MEYVRPSILHRPARSGSNCTAESADEQWRREQELLAAKSRRLQNAETRLLNVLYPSSEHVRARQAEMLEMQEQFMAAKAEAKKREAQLEAQISQKARCSAVWDQQLQPQQAAEPVRPWATSTLGYASEDEEREARKHFAAQMAADNLTLMAERAAQRKQQQQEQQLLERQVVTSESEYWNLGATNRRWIAPEHRHLAPPSPSARTAAAAATSEQAAAGRPAAAAAAIYVAPPWATHNQSVPAAAPVAAAAPAAAAAPPPWATYTPSAAAAGAGAQPWLSKAGTVAPPWATYTPQQPTRAIHASLGGADGMLQRSGSSAGSIGGSRDSSSMRPHTAGGFEHELPQSQRTSCKPQVVRKYPWEWHES